MQFTVGLIIFLNPIEKCKYKYIYIYISEVCYKKNSLQYFGVNIKI